MNSWFILCCFLVFFKLTAGEEVSFLPCPDEESRCEIHRVSVDPCKEAASQTACKIKRGKSASISLDFTPQFSGTHIKNQAYWTGGIMDLPFVGMDSNGCNYVQCPLAAGNRTTYNYNLVISKNFPTRAFDVKWKLWNEQKEQCCFIIEIKLVR